MNQFIPCDKLSEGYYQGFFAGSGRSAKEAPFIPSLFVVIKKRMGQSIFDVFHQTMVDAHDSEKGTLSTKSTITSKTDNKKIQKK